MSRARSGPTLEHRALAEHMRRLRERAGLSLDQAAGALGASTWTVRRLEAAQTAPDAGQIGTLLEAYQVSAAIREQVMAGLTAASMPGWWHRYREVLRPWETDALGVETAASLIRTWDPGLIPELLRTPAYAQALAGIMCEPSEHAEQRLELLAERQRRLRERDCILWVLVAESAFSARVGDESVMREQYEALTAAAEQPRVSVQVVRTAAPPHPLTGGPPAALLRVPVPEIGDYLLTAGPLGDHGGATLTQDPAVVSRFRQMLDYSCSHTPDRRTPLPLPQI